MRFTHQICRKLLKCAGRIKTRKIKRSSHILRRKRNHAFCNRNRLSAVADNARRRDFHILDSACNKKILRIVCFWSGGLFYFNRIDSVVQKNNKVDLNFILVPVKIKRRLNSSIAE